uniref:Uncharacterized protein n=1 Tax=Sipha flava TaxID=143950 RepID=A0A2S2QQ44_9HEMI
MRFRRRRRGITKATATATGKPSIRNYSYIFERIPESVRGVEIKPEEPTAPHSSTTTTTPYPFTTITRLYNYNYTAAAAAAGVRVCVCACVPPVPPPPIPPAPPPPPHNAGRHPFTQH